MLFWIWVIMLIAGLAVPWYYKKKHKGYSKLLSDVSDLLIGFGFLGSIVAGAIIIGFNLNVDGKIASLEEEYKVLVYQYENDIYANSIDLYKRDLLEEIRDWNGSLAKCKAAQDDFWVGVFVPDIYDQFEFIELK